MAVFRLVVRASAVGVAVMAASSAWGAIPPYTLAGSMPAAGLSAFDVLPDGRIIATSGLDVLVESAPGSGVMAPAGRLPAGAVSAFGASFIRVSPSGSRIAIGDNNFPGPQFVHVIETSSLAAGVDSPLVSVPAPNFDAAWNGDASLFVTGSVNFSTPAQVTRIDLGATPGATVVISGVGDGSGGVAIRGSTLYTGVGFDSAGVTTGIIRSFDLGTLASASSAAAFGSGAFVADVLSASPLDFDVAGNLLVGGGDFFGAVPDAGYVAVIDLVTGDRLELSPAGFAFYGVRYNAVRSEILVSDLFGASPAIYRYVVPAPSAAAVLVSLGLVAWRRRRA